MAWQTNEIPTKILSFIMNNGLTNKIPTRILSFIIHYDLTNKRNSNKDLIIYHAWSLTNKWNSNKDRIIYHALWPDKQTKFQQGSYHLSCMMAWQTDEIPTRILSFIMHDGLRNKRNSNKDFIIYHAWWRDKQTKFQQRSYHL